MAIDRKPNTVLMPGRTVLPTALYGLTMQILGYFSTGKHWAILGKFKGTIWAGNLKKSGNTGSGPVA